MIRSATTKNFWRLYADLPEQVRRQARTAFALWRDDPHYASLQFKPIQGLEGVVSVRIGIHWRALGRRRDGVIHWFWIGSHADYATYLARR